MPSHLERFGLSTDMHHTVSVGTNSLRRSAAANLDISNLAENAAKATAVEHSMTILDGLRTYPKALGWSILLSSAVVMEGFDTIIMGTPIPTSSKCRMPSC